ncbi:hypothetical protein A9Q74_05795 [Colwellia sp. 39_35_sub15_T18]|nr:hypothetical protein A9Q74_05795 [Colwellia sp. 39_35_sub15_T18]
MKKTNAYSYKLAIVATSFVMVYFASGIVSIAQATESLKAEPVVQHSLIEAAKDSLASSFTTLMVNDFSENDAETMIVTQQRTADTNQSMTLTKVTLISE